MFSGSDLKLLLIGGDLWFSLLKNPICKSKIGKPTSQMEYQRKWQESLNFFWKNKVNTFEVSLKYTNKSCKLFLSDNASLFQPLGTELANEEIGAHHASLLLEYYANGWSEKFL